MPRYAKKSSITELNGVINDIMAKNEDNDVAELSDIITYADECTGTSMLAKDVQAYSGQISETIDTLDDNHPMIDIMGSIQLNDIAVHGMIASNINHLFYICLYLDEKNHLRAYRPKQNNHIDIESGLLLGTDKKRDAILIQKYNHLAPEPLNASNECVITHLAEKEKLIQNIQNRIQLKKDV